MTEYEIEKQECLSAPPTTVAMADREAALWVGYDRPDCAWICSDRDVWYPNPAYQGPPVPHPEEYYDE